MTKTGRLASIEDVVAEDLSHLKLRELSGVEHDAAVTDEKSLAK